METGLFRRHQFPKPLSARSAAGTALQSDDKGRGPLLQSRLHEPITVHDTSIIPCRRSAAPGALSSQSAVEEKILQALLLESPPLRPAGQWRFA